MIGPELGPIKLFALHGGFGAIHSIAHFKRRATFLTRQADQSCEGPGLTVYWDRWLAPRARRLKKRWLSRQPFALSPSKGNGATRHSRSSSYNSSICRSTARSYAVFPANPGAPLP